MTSNKTAQEWDFPSPPPHTISLPCFQATLIIESNLNSEIFVPGFNIKVQKLNEEKKVVELSKEEKYLKLMKL